MRFNSAKIQLFARLRSAVLTHFQVFSQKYTFASSKYDKCWFQRNIRKTAKPDTMAVWHCKLDTPIQILYNACKNISCKTTHATHAKRRRNSKSKQSRRNCEMKQQCLKTVTFILVTENKKINFMVAPQQNIKNIKVRGLYILNNKTVSFTIRVNTGLSLGFCLELCVN